MQQGLLNIQFYKDLKLEPVAYYTNCFKTINQTKIWIINLIDYGESYFVTDDNK